MGRRRPQENENLEPGMVREYQLQLALLQFSVSPWFKPLK
jgi:hypothetical protein